VLIERDTRGQLMAALKQLNLQNDGELPRIGRPPGIPLVRR